MIKPRMRLGFFGQSGPYAPPALRQLLRPHHAYEIALVVEGRRQALRGREHRVLDPEPKISADGDDLHAIAANAGIPVLASTDINAPEAIRLLERFALDWIVCVGFDRLFAPAVLERASVGAINAHPSKLPRWRGPSPLFWMLKAGERDGAVTLHGIDEKEDHGPIYAQESFVVPRRVRGEELYGIAGALAGRMLVPALERAAQGGLLGTPQDHRLATRAPRPKPEDVLIEPKAWNCERLVDFACAAPYFRTPWLRLGEDVFFVRGGIGVEVGRTMPGEYLVSGSTLVVSCRDGLVHLEIQV